MDLSATPSSPRALPVAAPATASPAAARLTIDLNAVVWNWLSLQDRVAPAQCAAVVKADAYGLGAAPVSQALYEAGCRTFFVALVDEGLRLRQTLPNDARIVVLHGPLPGAEADCQAHGLIPVLNSPDQIERHVALARQQGRALPAALQVDTGMARLGLQAHEVQQLQQNPTLLQGLDLQLVMSHLVSAEEAHNPLNAIQRQRFEALRRLLPPCPASLANSSGIFLDSSFHLDLVRPGAALYGVAPAVDRPNPMQPVIRLQASLLQVREVHPGEGVGYNHTWHADRVARIGTVSVGYADGFLRSLSNHSMLHIQGHPLPLIGRVSMDTVTVDASAVPPHLLAPGTLVDVIDSTHDINVLAQEAGTNAYEILTQLGPRYARHYLPVSKHHHTAHTS
jgi:alanine racemase